MVSTLLIPAEWVLKRIRNTRKWIDKQLKWNWTIRLLMEGLMDISFASVITIRYANKDSFGGFFNLCYAYVLFFAGLALPVYTQVFYQWNFKRMADPDDEKFHKKYGAPYEGLN